MYLHKMCLPRCDGYLSINLTEPGAHDNYITVVGVYTIIYRYYPSDRYIIIIIKSGDGPA